MLAAPPQHHHHHHHYQADDNDTKNGTHLAPYQSFLALNNPGIRDAFWNRDVFGHKISKRNRQFPGFSGNNVIAPVQRNSKNDLERAWRKAKRDNCRKKNIANKSMNPNHWENTDNFDVWTRFGMISDCQQAEATPVAWLQRLDHGTYAVLHAVSPRDLSSVPQERASHWSAEALDDKHRPSSSFTTFTKALVCHMQPFSSKLYTHTISPS